MSYYFFMDKTQLPVPPAKMQIKITNKNKTLNLINDGEVNILKSAGLTDVSFDVLLPNVKYPWANYMLGFQKAAYYLDVFKKLKTGNKPFQFIVCRMTPKYDLLFNTNLQVSLEDYSINEDAGNGFDVIVSISLKQYKPYATKIIEVKKKEDSKKEDAKTATVKKIRKISKEISKISKVVKDSQTLWEICKSNLGNTDKLWEIAKLNNVVNPNSISGKVIKFVK